MMRTVPGEAIILAGGLGTRLRPAVSDVPKPMAPVAGRPFLEYLMDYWVHQGIRRFVLSIGYKGDLIEAHFGSRFRNCPISYVQEDTPLGTGGGVRQVLLQTQWLSDKAILINGDTWFEVDIGKLTSDAASSAQPITIVLKPTDTNDRYGGVAVDTKGRISEFGVKTTGKCLINGGCYLFDVATVTNSLRDFPECFSLEEAFLTPFAREGKVAASIQDGTFLDIGIPTDYAKAVEAIGQAVKTNFDMNNPPWYQGKY